MFAQPAAGGGGGGIGQVQVVEISNKANIDTTKCIYKLQDTRYCCKQLKQLPQCVDVCFEVIDTKLKQKIQIPRPEDTDTTG